MILTTGLLCTWIGLVDEVGSLLDGGEEGGGPHGRPHVVPVVPQVQAYAVVHLLQIRRMEMSASRRSATKIVTIH